MNLCTGCGQDFASVAAFDAHRVGKYPQMGPAEYDDRVRAGLTDEDWRPELGRRCLTVEELTAAGFVMDEHGRWRFSQACSRGCGR